MTSTHLFGKALDAASDGVVIAESKLVNHQRPIIYVNPAFERMTGYLAAEVIGKDCRFLNQHCRDQANIDVLRESLALEKPCVITLLNHRKNGEPFWNELSISPLINEDGVVTHFVGIQKDITERVKQEQFIVHQQQLLLEKNNKLLRLIHQNTELEELATHDTLTKLYNRLYFEKELQRLWAVHHRLQTALGIAFIDIDSFKAYNDCYGHVQGDKALQAVADTLKQHFSRELDLTARVGGEEFVVASSVATDHDFFLQQIETLRESIQKLCICHQQSRSGPYLTISIGVYVNIPPVQSTPEFFIKKADEAMYLAKSRGGNCYVRLN